MPVRKDDPRRSAVYRLYSQAAQLLYIGAAVDPEARWRNLESTESWWELVSRETATWYDTGGEALEVETAAIRAEQPLFNLTGYRFPNSGGHLRRLRLTDGRTLPVYRGLGGWLIGYGEIADEREQHRLKALTKLRARRPTESEVLADKEWAAELSAAGYAAEGLRARRVAEMSQKRRDKAFGGPPVASPATWQVLASTCEHPDGECPGVQRTA